MRLVKLGAAPTPFMVLMTDSADGKTGKPGLTLSVTASKAGGAFGAISPTVTDRGNGWYSIAPGAGDCDTLGELVIRATATGADPGERVALVVAFDPNDAAGLGLSRIDVPVGTRSTYAGGPVASVTGPVIAASVTNPVTLDLSQPLVNRKDATTGGALLAIQASVLGTRVRDTTNKLIKIFSSFSNLTPFAVIALDDNAQPTTATPQ